ncbi:hypothetical protein [Paenibacillus ferrarius]|nr:hypothetical protein [Paenibacillus ferrarius]
MLKKLKTVPFILSFAIAFSVFSPTFALAAKPAEQNKVSTAVTINQQNQQQTYADGTVVISGWKKSIFIFALKKGGALFEEFLEWLGKKEYADIIREHRYSIADWLEHAENVLTSELVDFMIFELGIPQGAARVIAEAIIFFIV